MTDDEAIDPEPQLVEGEQKLFCDFDNTLTKENVEYWNDERPEVDPIVAERVRSHYYAGGFVVIWTARPWSEAYRIAAHLTEWQIPFDGIRCEKGSGDVYVDDKAKHPDEF
jgi:hypothetical protein